MTAAEMETDGDESSGGAEIVLLEKGEGSNVMFSRESPLLGKESRIPKAYGCSAKRLRSKAAELSEEPEKNKSKLDRKFSRSERIELGRMFQGAVSSHDGELTESLILLADAQTHNNALCIALDSIWFLKTRQEELDGITGLITKIVSNGANDFTRVALRMSFLASWVSACQSNTMSLADTVNAMAQRLHEQLQECNGNEVLKAEAGSKVQKFTEWALNCIGFHSQCQESRGRGNRSMILEIRLQLSAFKNFLDLAGNNLTGKDYTEAFDAACFPLTLFSSSFDAGWASGTSAIVIQGLLGDVEQGSTRGCVKSQEMLSRAPPKDVSSSRICVHGSASSKSRNKATRLGGVC